MARVIVLLLACVFASGCFVFDELDKGQEILEQHSPLKPAEAPAQNAPAAQAGGGAQAGEAWWAKAKSLSGPPAGEGEDAVVTCRVGNTTRFMRQGDCLSQGGSPRS